MKAFRQNENVEPDALSIKFIDFAKGIRHLTLDSESSGGETKPPWKIKAVNANNIMYIYR